MLLGQSGGGGGDDGGKSGRRFQTTFMGRKAAIRFVNRPAMEGLAYKSVYGRAISRDVRRALMWLAVYQAKYLEQPPAEKLNASLQTANDCSRPTARGHLKLAVDWGLISEEEDGVNTFYFLSPAQVEKANRLLDLLDAIADVVRLQSQNPSDKRAGSHLVPAEVYYNVIEKQNFRED
jgi:hypothetical protein